MIFSFNLQPGAAQSKAGFGLIELLVSISIMVLVTSIVLSRHSAFNGTVLIKSQAYEIALRMREIQLSAVSVATSTVSTRSEYGVLFRNTETGGYAVFATPMPAAHNFYLSNNFTRVGELGLLDQRFFLKGFNLNCTSGVVTPVSGLIILFKRPNYDAEFRNFNGGNPVCVADSVTIRIAPRGTVAADTAAERTITVTRAGQISVD